jgi:hypothetical protein
VLLQVADQLSDDGVALDGGANGGLVCVLLARHIRERGGQVHAFEAQRVTTPYVGPLR